MSFNFSLTALYLSHRKRSNSPEPVNRPEPVNHLTPSSFNNSLSRLLTLTLLSSVMTLTACQQTNDNEGTANNDSADAAAQAEPTTQYQSDNLNDPEASANSSYTITDDGTGYNNEVALDDNLAENGNAVKTLQETRTIERPSPDERSSPENQTANSGNTAATSPSSSANTQAAPTTETQITEVEYQDGNGRSIHVTFNTSANKALQANVRMPSGKRMLLVAPPGQGNNPTYRSADGVVELVTHAGGNKVDFIFEGQSINFTAVDTEAAIVKSK